MQVSFGGVYLVRGHSLNAGYDPQVERAVRRIQKEADKRDIPVADIRTQRAGLPSTKVKGAVTQEVRAVFTADDAIAARPLIDEINGNVRKFREGKLSQKEMKSYLAWWRQLHRIIGQGISGLGVTPVETINRDLTKKRLDIVSGPQPRILPTEVLNPELATNRFHAVAQHDPPVRLPGTLSRAVSWLRERLA